MQQAGFHEHVGAANICASIAEALVKAKIVHIEALNRPAPDPQRAIVIASGLV
jgi:hypothetical protein